MTVFSTTRSKEKSQALKDIGVDHILIDDGRSVAQQVREIMPAGVDAALELIGTNTLKDTLGALREGGTCCFTGMLSNKWSVGEIDDWTL